MACLVTTHLGVILWSISCVHDHLSGACYVQEHQKHLKEVEAHLQESKGQLQSTQQQHAQLEEANNGLTQQLEQASTSKSAAVEELAKKKDEVDHLTEELQVAHKRVEIVEADIERVNKQLQVRSAIMYIHQCAQHNLCFLLIFLVLLYMHQQIMHQRTMFCLRDACGLTG